MRRNQSVRELLHGAEPIRRHWRQRAAHDGIQRVGGARAQDTERRRWLRETPGDHRLRGGTGERGLAREHLVAEGAKRVEIGPGVYRRVTARLLRAHVGGGAERETGGGQPLARFCAERACNAEVRHQRVPVGKQNVVRLDVAVENPFAVSVGERFSHVERDSNRLVQWQHFLAVEAGAERLSVDIRHRVPQLAGRLSGVQERDDTPVDQPRGHANLSVESVGGDGAVKFGSQNLECHPAFVRHVACHIHDRHPARADLAFDRVSAGESGFQRVDGLRAWRVAHGWRSSDRSNRITKSATVSTAR